MNERIEMLAVQAGFNIHDDVIYLTCVLIDKYKESDALIQQYKTKSKTGIYIINLINTIEYDNAILKDQIDLYINYLFFFQNTQTTYLSKLNNKMKTKTKTATNNKQKTINTATNNEKKTKTTKNTNQINSMNQKT